MKKLFATVSNYEVTLKQVLERLDKQAARQSNLLDKLGYDVKQLFRITAHHTDLIEKQERIQNWYKEANIKVTYIKTID